MKRALVQFVMIVGVISLVFVSSASALNLNPGCETNLSAAECALLKQDEISQGSTNNRIQTIIYTALGILGGLAVIMIIFAGFTYTTSAGDAQKITTAKNMILYALIGIAVAILATSIVYLVTRVV